MSDMAVCTGCDRTRPLTEMAWTTSEPSRWWCAECREIVCPHWRSLLSFCGKCWQLRKAGAPRRGAMRAEWPAPERKKERR